MIVQEDLKPGYVRGTYYCQGDDISCVYERYHPSVRSNFLKCADEFVKKLTQDERNALLKSQTRRESLLNDDTDFLRAHYGYNYWPSLKDNLLARLFKEK